MSKILITGISGSAGTYLAEYLSRGITMSDSPFEVHGTSRSTKENKSYKIHQCDLNDFSAIFNLLRQIQPDYIFNLAANADVRGSFDSPLAILNNNINSTANLLQSVVALQNFRDFNPRIVHISTSEVYGIITEKDCPVPETYPLKPVNVYAVSKLTQEQLALAYHKMYGLKVIVTRAFGYINPRRHNIFSTAFAKQLIEIERGKRKTLEYGNLDSVRTLMDVRDICRAYWYAAQCGDFGEIYNIGSTQPISVKEFLDILVNKVQEKRKREANPLEIRAWQNPDLMRPIDVTLQIPDTRKFLAKTGFHCEYTLDQSIDWLLETLRNG